MPEPTDAPASETTTTATAAAPAATPATPAAAEPVVTLQDAAAHEEKAEGDYWKTFNEKANQLAETPAADAVEPEAAEDAAEEPAPTEDPTKAPEAAATPAISPLEANLLKRFHCPPATAKAYSLMSQDERAEFIGDLERRQAFTDKLLRERGKAPTAPAAGDPNAPPAAAPTVDDFWKPIADFYGQEAADPLRKAVMNTFEAGVQNHLAQAVQPLAEEHVQMREFLLEQMRDTAIDAVAVPDGIDKNDPAVRKQLEDAMLADLKGRFDWRQNNFKHSATRVVSQLFSKQLAAAAAQKKQQQATRALRGTPDSTTRPPRTEKRTTEEDREALWFQGTNKGLSGDALQRFVEAGGA